MGWDGMAPLPGASSTNPLTPSLALIGQDLAPAHVLRLQQAMSVLGQWSL